MFSSFLPKVSTLQSCAQVVMQAICTEIEVSNSSINCVVTLVINDQLCTTQNLQQSAKFFILVHHGAGWPFTPNRVCGGLLAALTDHCTKGNWPCTVHCSRDDWMHENISNISAK